MKEFTHLKPRKKSHVRLKMKSYSCCFSDCGVRIYAEVGKEKIDLLQISHENQAVELLEVSEEHRKLLNGSMSFKKNRYGEWYPVIDYD